ncbi:MAG: hypothetical protein H0V89_12050 [Deltaproteobacteria bacterium]|nr:hypothetical protein [Deltaproteobacteria bacterium]
MMYRTLAFAGLVSLFSGCNGTKEESPEELAFQRDWAAGWCDRQAECAQADYDSQWQDNEECIDNKSTDAEFNSAFGDILCGDFDAGNTQACLDAMDDADCADWSNNEWRNECGLVYGC